VDYVEVRNNKAGTTVLMKLNGTQILALTEAGIWHKIKAATGEEVPFFPAMPNPLEGPDGKIPWELQSETASAETSSPPPSNNSEGCTVGRLAGSPSGAQKSAPSENPTGNSAWMLILAIAALASRLFKSKQRA
ncbi:hypothetical protein HY604_05125, partial [Candidatus Peregrinibacteria bacterium]|nr:hypothetical protein [Candidatus Peregrinibacteria bacterium]